MGPTAGGQRVCCVLGGPLAPEPELHTPVEQRGQLQGARPGRGPPGLPASPSHHFFGRISNSPTAGGSRAFRFKTCLTQSSIILMHCVSLTGFDGLPPFPDRFQGTIIQQLDDGRPSPVLCGVKGWSLNRDEGLCPGPTPR